MAKIGSQGRGQAFLVHLLSLSAVPMAGKLWSLQAWARDSASPSSLTVRRVRRAARSLRGNVGGLSGSVVGAIPPGQLELGSE